MTLWVTLLGPFLVEGLWNEKIVKINSKSLELEMEQPPKVGRCLVSVGQSSSTSL